ncbi:hypothetical protein BDZ94DRAFT_984887 [Collybia nuda]|uniref:NACHT domain-containing protein n=1 Tax=Collybia nuda TaxID=64659 RepID=A0A9P6CF43_9AGAR|nr:hypothetical protein BDZ94DRAFT_984887 [Collybia nuda]
MAFAKSSNFTINHSKFVDKSTIKQITASDSKNQSGDGLQRLLNAVSTDASFDSQARYPPPRCDENTRRALITHILQWIDSGKEDILFLHGPAGAGKSAIAQTVASACAETQTLAGSYFFFRGSPSRNTMTPLIPTITYDMTSSAPRKRRKVERVVKGNPSILSKSPEFQLHKLILEPHRRSLILRVFWIQKKRRLLIIDGLDECNNDRDQRRVVELLGQLSDKKRGVVRCLIASRPEPQILSAMNSLPTNIRVTRVTLNEESWDANKDIYAYFRSHFDEISSRLPLSIPRPWPSDEIIETLVQKAGGIFIYASTVVKYVDDQDSLPTIQLEHVLKLSPGTTPFAELDMLYQQILTACPSRHLSTLLHIFGFIFLRNPGLEEFYDVSLIEALLDLSPGEVAVVLRRMHSILTITTTENDQVNTS